ncbi:MAG TPA: CBS domain-containing protein [Acidimicrobiales bacterium]|nr:CBS domain-containing protein [Acidimicrobiales bacterium]
MADTIREMMTPDPVTVDESATLRNVAVLMRDKDLGDVVVTRGGRVGGIVTDRDIVVRAVAAGEDPDGVLAGDICSSDLTTVPPEATVQEAARMMGDAAIRRLVVMDGDEAVGIVSLGDIARHQDPRSPLAELSAEPPNN